MTTLISPIASAKTNDLVFVSQTNELVTDSFHVAKYFGKLHKNVLQKLQQLECSKEFTQLNFQLCHKNNELQNNKLQPFYQMTKNGFMFLVMGFTGKRSAEIKERYIQAFDDMAEQLTKSTRIQPPAQTNTLTLPDFHRQRVLLCIENGAIVSKRMLDSDEMLMNRKSYINYFKEPDIGFSDIDQLVELSNSVNERIRIQVRNIQ
ncbi:Rha family transcriptional regulator [Vibrio parahaemolyticus]|nr:Rha family transcriptional regulator [Vibrio parahaemolyticus]EJE8673467.1 Rha family transcriptional regulator [Vibrio parahaemolyticus]